MQLVRHSLRRVSAVVLLLFIALTSCAPTTERGPEPAPGTLEATPAPLEPTEAPTPTSQPSTASEVALADVIAAEVSGDPQAYRFAVEVRSPDLGCEQYADWWEVLREDGSLVYRRILAHSHVDEQPFVRSGGPVAIAADTVVLVRAHMHPTGYGGAALRGTVSSGFVRTDLGVDFAADVEDSAPQPDGCAF